MDSTDDAAICERCSKVLKFVQKMNKKTEKNVFLLLKRLGEKPKNCFCALIRQLPFKSLLPGQNIFEYEAFKPLIGGEIYRIRIYRFLEKDIDTFTNTDFT